MNKNAMSAKLKISKVLRSLLVVSLVSTSLVAAPHLSEARTFPARGGSAAFVSEAACWRPFGPAMTNTCDAARDWYLPLTIDPVNSQFPPGFMYNSTVTVRAQRATPNSNVSCLAQGYDVSRNWVFSSGWTFLLTFGAPASINLSLLVPDEGSGMVDCNVDPNGQVIEASW